MAIFVILVMSLSKAESAGVAENKELVAAGFCPGGGLNHLGSVRDGIGIKRRA